jgi:hypothetical protein
LGKRGVEVQMRLDGTPQGEPITVSGAEARQLAEALREKARSAETA